MSLGNLALKLATLLALVAFGAAVSWARGNEGSRRVFVWSYHGLTACLALASALLMASILGHDFRFEYVINYSSRDLPLVYLISSFWAGQDGTYLLWALLGALVGYSLFRRRSWEPATAMAVYMPTIGFMLALMLVPDGNPFRMVAQAPPDGHGLNPLLQDPWMAIHPPLVFLGYVAMTVPAVLALTALLRRDDEPWLGPALRWALVGFIGLGAGIVLGGFWAYKVLGWGGYWGWDPVENASLIPWIVVTALLHGLLVQKFSGALRRTNLVLALAGYLLVLYATFLTRSGVLADFSVHSFPQGSIYRILVAILLFTLAASVVAFLRARVPLGKNVPVSFSWPMILSWVIVLFGISAAFVLILTSWPILSSLAGQPSAIKTSAYNFVSLPLYVALLTVLGVAPFVGWTPAQWSRLIPRAGFSLLLAAIGTFAAAKFGGHGLGNLLLFFVSLFALVSNVLRFIEVARVRLLLAGAAVAHVGFALMFTGIVASSAWGDGRQASLPLGQPVEVLGNQLTYGGHVDGSEPQDRWKVAVKKTPGGVEVPAEVHMFRLPGGRGNESYFHRPAILRGLSSDLYIAPQGLEVLGGNRQIELGKEEPVALADADLTFLHFETRGMGAEHGMTVLAHVRVRRGDSEEVVALPYTVAQGGPQAAAVEPALTPGLSLTLQRMSVEAGRILVLAEDLASPQTEVLGVEVSTKPLINLLWVGTLLLGVGCTMALVRRYIDGRAESANA
jgi:cytochrome c-type biogenesis protein CcmF